MVWGKEKCIAGYLLHKKEKETNCQTQLEKVYLKSFHPWAPISSWTLNRAGYVPGWEKSSESTVDSIDGINKTHG